jgi:methyl-accepting chemotaxis protein
MAGRDEHEYQARVFFERTDNPEDETWKILEINGSRVLHYFAAVRMESNCQLCHQTDGAIRSGLPESLLTVFNQASQAGGINSAGTDAAGQMPADSAINDAFTRPARRAPLYSIATIKLPMDTVDGQLAHNRAVLLATAILTSFLAMLTAWAIVRFIIVKPVQHLKDVSDQIARGNLNLRADISTGDEFEELSHAFNRMLRHMMTVNDELRNVNENLDAKIDQLRKPTWSCSIIIDSKTTFWPPSATNSARRSTAFSASATFCRRLPTSTTVSVAMSPTFKRPVAP